MERLPGSEKELKDYEDLAKSEAEEKLSEMKNESEE